MNPAQQRPNRRWICGVCDSMGSGLVNAWRRLEDFDFGVALISSVARQSSEPFNLLSSGTASRPHGSTIDPRLDPLNTVEKSIWTTDFSAVSMMSVLTFRNPNLRACRLQIGHECEGIVGRYPCIRRLRL